MIGNVADNLHIQTHSLPKVIVFGILKPRSIAIFKRQPVVVREEAGDLGIDGEAQSRGKERVPERVSSVGVRIGKASRASATRQTDVPMTFGATIKRTASPKLSFVGPIHGLERRAHSEVRPTGKGDERSNHYLEEPAGTIGEETWQGNDALKQSHFPTR